MFLVVPRDNMSALLKYIKEIQREVTEVGRHYPLFCFLLVSMATATLLLNRLELHYTSPSHPHLTSLEHQWLEQFSLRVPLRPDHRGQQRTGSRCVSGDGGFCVLCLQVPPHPDALLVLPGWSGHLLLLPGTRVSAPKRPVHHKVQNQSTCSALLCLMVRTSANSLGVLLSFTYF